MKNRSLRYYGNIIRGGGHPLLSKRKASPILEKGSTDSGTGRWSVLKFSTMSFFEYCRLLELDEPELPEKLRLSGFVEMSKAELGDLMSRFTPLQNHFNRYLMIGGFPELALSDDDVYAQRMLREDVVDKVIKRDVLSDERELGAMVEAAVYKHMLSFYQGSPAQLGYFRKAKDNQKEVDVVVELPRQKILCEVKYRINSHIPALVLLYFLGKAETEGSNGKM